MSGDGAVRPHRPKRLRRLQLALLCYVSHNPRCSCSEAADACALGTTRQAKRTNGYASINKLVKHGLLAKTGPVPRAGTPGVYELTITEQGRQSYATKYR